MWAPWGVVHDTRQRNRVIERSWVLLLALALVLAGLATPVYSQTAAGASAPSNPEWGQIMEYRIGPSDVLTIRVRGHEDLDQAVTVRPDGKLSFSLVGDVTAAGLTPVELQAAMEAALAEYINILAGEVTVVVDEIHSYTVSVLGEVRQPGRFEFQNRVSVLDALAQAGGLTEFASSSNIVIFRTYMGKDEKLEFDFNRLVKSAGTSAWVPVLPGDIILVP
jgi:polysaccharide export outer membrane protein